MELQAGKPIVLHARDHHWIWIEIIQFLRCTHAQVSSWLGGLEQTAFLIWRHIKKQQQAGLLPYNCAAAGRYTHGCRLCQQDQLHFLPRLRSQACAQDAACREKPCNHGATA